MLYSTLRLGQKRPERDVGPPPDKAVPGRMNAAGISVFYGATDADLALGEVQAPVGSKVLIGHFEILQPLMLLDLKALERVVDERGSIFDSNYGRRLKRADFLRGLCHRISKPVMPTDRERDYLPTQAIADFLATTANPPIDGILYPSVQAGYPTSPFEMLARGTERRNVVLFHNACRIQPCAVSENAVISIEANPSPSITGAAITGPACDQPDLDYVVCEECPPNEEMEAEIPRHGANDPLLRLAELEVRYVRAIKFETVSRTVRRYPAPKCHDFLQ
jgi:hypothetical protein